MEVEAPDNIYLFKKPNGVILGTWFLDSNEQFENIEYIRTDALKMKEVDLENSMTCNVDWYDGFLLDYTQEQQDTILKKLGVNVGDKVRVIILKEE